MTVMKTAETEYSIGMDLGTDSARAVLVEVSGPEAGKELSSFTSDYKRWKKGLYCDASRNQFRQHPQDYVDAVAEALQKVASACPDKDKIVSIGIDSTGSTPCLIDSNLTPLCMLPGHENDPDAMFVLWKDHTGEPEAREINALLPEFPVNYSSRCGTPYTPENFWAKVLHVLRSSEGLRRDAFSAIELCDFIPAMLTGCRNVSGLRMSHAVAGGKWMWAEEWGGFPPEDFFKALDPVLLPLLKNLPRKNFDSNEAAGHLCSEWASRLGLSENVLVGVGNIDSYSGGVGAGVEYKRMIMNLGTSACCMCVVPDDLIAGRIVPGVFGQVEGMLVPGNNGFEVGLSAYGDAFAWVKRLLSWPVDKFVPEEMRSGIKDRMLAELDKEAMTITPRVDAPVATDHLNGRRCPYVNSSLTGTIGGLRLSTSAPELFYAIVESTAFATKAIIDHMKANDVAIEELVAVGGVSQKSPFAMQMLSDVTGYSISVSAGKNAGAMGAVINSSVAAGVFKEVPEAQKVLCPPVLKTYSPDRSKSEIFGKRYQRYLEMVKFNEKNYF